MQIASYVRKLQFAIYRLSTDHRVFPTNFNACVNNENFVFITTYLAISMPIYMHVYMLYVGMDQNKTNVPNLFPTPKAVQSVFRLQTHRTGALAHTRADKGKKAYSFYDVCQWPQNCNLTIHALLNVLVDFNEHLPEVLYLQLDNAGTRIKINTY